MAITHFARALGAARSGDPQAAQADIAKLAELRDKLREAKDAYWSEIVDIQWQVASAWSLYAEGKYDAALKALSAAADAEDKTEKAPGDAGPDHAGARTLRRDVARARHGQGSAGDVRGDARRRSRHRLGAEIGAARAAEKAGDRGDGQGALRRGGCAWRGGRPGASGDRRRPRLHGEGEGGRRRR